MNVNSVNIFISAKTTYLMCNSGKAILNGKTYSFEKIGDSYFIEGKPMNEWISILDDESRSDLYKLGVGIKEGRMKNNFQNVVKDFHTMRNN